MRLCYWACLCLLIVCPTLTPAGIGEESLLVIDNFNEGIQNRLGGFYNTFESHPSQASFIVTDKVFRGETGKSLRLDIERGTGGFCGAWMHFFNFRAKPAEYLDVTPYGYLSFWIKGQQGGENFDIKLSDARWIAKEDGLRIADVTRFLPKGITKEWQEVLIPLDRVGSLDLKQLGGITFDFTTQGKQTIYVDDVCFKSNPQIPTPVTRMSIDIPPPSKPFPRALWIWNVEPLLNDIVARQKLFEFCRQENINTLWIQLLYAFDPEIDFTSPPDLDDPIPETRCTIHHQEKFRELIRHAHELKLRVHALDGYPEYAQKEFHQAPLSVVDAVIAFNKNSDPSERFDGVHFDNEPYLLVGWQDAAVRQRILSEFLELNQECQRRVRERSEMEFGVDIPFWWQRKDGETGRHYGHVEYNGREDAASFFCIDLLDNVGIMNYRDRAGGADGMIAHGQEILEYADKTGGAEVYMGVETFTYDPTDVWFVTGLPRDTFAEIVKDKAKGLTMLSRVHGYRVQALDDGLNVHVGIELPPAPGPEALAKIQKTMLVLARGFGTISEPESIEEVEPLLKAAEFAILADVEWDGFRRKKIVDPETDQQFSGFVATSIMLSKTTFADNTLQEMQDQVRSAEDFFRRYKRYRGIAIHYYETYRKIVSEATPQDP